MRILLATPTRGRPDEFKRMAHSARATASENHNLSIVARLDRDDPKRGGYISGNGYRILQGKRVRLPQAWNEIVETERYDILMMCADDLRFRTTGWDDDVREVFDSWPDRVGMVYADDGIHGVNLATHSFVSREFVEAVGFYLPPTMYGDFVDNFLHTLASNIGRCAYLPRTFIEHLHPIAHKAPWDDTYQYRWTEKGRSKAQKAWQEVLSSGVVNQAITDLKEAMA